MATDWETRRAYIKALSELRLELNREMDRAQVGEELQRRDDHLTELIHKAQGLRSGIILDQEMEYEATHPVIWDAPMPPPLRAL